MADEFEINDVFNPPLVDVRIVMKDNYLADRRLWALEMDVGGSEPLVRTMVYVSPWDYWVRPSGHGAPPLVRVRY